MSGVLVDTSVWSDHFRRGNQTLVDLLTADQVYCHPMVIGEIACGTPPERSRTIAFMGLLHQAQQASHAEVLELIEREDLFGQGCGLVDIMLLASTMLTPGLRLWTADKRLSLLAQRFGVCHNAPIH